MPAEIDALFSQYDADNSGSITFRELYRMIRHNPDAAMLMKLPPKPKKQPPKVEVLEIDSLRKQLHSMTGELVHVETELAVARRELAAARRAWPHVGGGRLRA